MLWRNLERPLEAKLHYERAHKLDPVSVRAHMRLAELEVHLGATAEAQNVLHRLRRIALNLPGLDTFERQLRNTKRP